MKWIVFKSKVMPKISALKILENIEYIIGVYHKFVKCCSSFFQSLLIQYAAEISIYSF